MLLRSTLEKHVAVRDDEDRLPDEVRNFAFRGVYAKSTGIVGAHWSHYVPERRLGRPIPAPQYLRPIYRTSMFTGREYTSGWGDITGYKYNKRGEYYIHQLLSPRILERANRIEQLARRTKLAVGTLLVAAGVTAFVASGETSTDHHYSLQPAPITTSIGPHTLNPEHVTPQGGVAAPESVEPSQIYGPPLPQHLDPR